MTDHELLWGIYVCLVLIVLFGQGLLLRLIGK